MVTSFNDLAELGVKHFQNLFKVPNGTSLAEIIQITHMFPRFAEEIDNGNLMEEVSKEELKEVLHSFQHDKSPGPDGWTIEIYLGFFELVGEDILEVVEESKRSGVIHAPINATFISLIPKVDKAKTFDDFGPISLCNCLYKIILKVVSRRLKEVLSKNISMEQFGFLQGRQIHEAIGVAQEALHNLKSKNISGVVLKLDLSKAYDRVSWLYVKMMLIHLGFDIGFVRWVMGCILTASFVVLINIATSPLFKVEQGLRQGCPLSPLIFLLVAEGLSRFLKEAVRRGDLTGLILALGINLTHLLFVDDILLFDRGTRRDIDCLYRGLNMFKTTTGMVINLQKLAASFFHIEDTYLRYMTGFFPIQALEISEGIKYLGFFLKPNDYRKSDWKWLIGKLEKILMLWSNKWLSRADRLTLVKSVLEAIPVYWMSIAWIPKGV